MDEFTRAFRTIAEVMHDGARTHPDNDWIERPPEYHAGRAEEHLRLLRAGGQQQDHLSHACCRLLMALTVRQLG